MTTITTKRPSCVGCSKLMDIDVSGPAEFDATGWTLDGKAGGWVCGPCKERPFEIPCTHGQDEKPYWRAFLPCPHPRCGMGTESDRWTVHYGAYNSPAQQTRVDFERKQDVTDGIVTYYWKRIE